MVARRLLGLCHTFYKTYVLRTSKISNIILPVRHFGSSKVYYLIGLFVYALIISIQVHLTIEYRPIACVKSVYIIRLCLTRGYDRVWRQKSDRLLYVLAQVYLDFVSQTWETCQWIYIHLFVVRLGSAASSTDTRWLQLNSQLFIISRQTFQVNKIPLHSVTYQGWSNSITNLRRILWQHRCTGQVQPPCRLARSQSTEYMGPSLTARQTLQLYSLETPLPMPGDAVWSHIVPHKR